MIGTETNLKQGQTDVEQGELTLIVTIDGPAGTGKSSVGSLLADKLGLTLLDTGAMYRAATAIVLDQSIDVTDEDRVFKAVEAEDLHFDFEQNPPAMLCSGVSVDARIREPDVTSAVSAVSALPRVRALMVRKQRIVSHQRPRLVAEGRDQGSVVFPDADVKFFLEASAEVRANRRAEQMRARPGADRASINEADILERIIERDRLDSTRTVGPLVCPDDAIRIDTSSMSFEEVVEQLFDQVVAQVGIARIEEARRDGGAGE